jgi:hypothetical protein
MQAPGDDASARRAAQLCAGFDAEDADGAARALAELVYILRDMEPGGALPPALTRAPMLSALLVVAGGPDLQREFAMGYPPLPRVRCASAPDNALLLLSRLVHCAPAVSVMLCGGAGAGVLCGAAPHLLAALLPVRAGERCAMAALLLSTLVYHETAGGALVAQHGDMYFPLLADAVADLCDSGVVMTGAAHA